MARGLARSATVGLAAVGGGAARRRSGVGVQVVCLDRDDIVVIAQFASLSAESEVGDVGDRRRAVVVEAERPFVLVLVLQLKLQLLVLEICETKLGRDAGVTDASSGASSKLSVLAVIVLVVGLLAVAKHGHNVGEHDSGSVVLVRVDEDTKSLESVGASEYIALLSTLSRHPHSESISIELVFATKLKLHLYFPVGCSQGDTREQPSRLRRAVGGQSNVPGRFVSAKCDPA